MTGFRPRVAVSADPAPGRACRTLWIAASVGAFVAIGLLVATGDEAPDGADPATLKATRASSGSGVPQPRIADLPPPDPYKPDPAGKALLQELTLPPTRARSGVTGYVVTKADADLLSHTALREGDVLLEIDGQKLEPAQLAEELGEYDDVWLVFERDGKKQEMLLELRRR